MSFDPNSMDSATLKNMGETAAVARATGMLEGAGYKGANSEAVRTLLEDRYDICSVADLGMGIFLEPIQKLIASGSNPGGLNGRVNDLAAMRRVIAESNGELRQKFMRR